MDTQNNSKVTDRPTVIFLSAVVIAFTSGAGAWMFLTNNTEERTRAVVTEMKNEGALQVVAKESEATTQRVQEINTRLDSISSQMNQMYLRIESLESGNTESQTIVVPPTEIPVDKATFLLSNQLIVKPTTIFSSLKHGTIELTVGSNSPEKIQFQDLPFRKSISLSGQDYFIDILNCENKTVTISIVQKL
jgi:hypothetical protein